jgi:hypothetical protein
MLVYMPIGTSSALARLRTSSRSSPRMKWPTNGGVTLWAGSLIAISG